MEESFTLKKAEVSTGPKVRKNSNRGTISHKKALANNGLNNLFAESDENFISYLKRQGLVDEPNLLVLPSSNHYFYDNSELKGVTTLINLKKLNKINHLDSFLNTVSDVLSPKSNFVGCFYDCDGQKEIGIASRMYKRFINFLDSKTDNEIDKNDVSKLLESSGYKVIDMTVINGLTYFRTQNLGLSA
jgi:hypothetical protein